MRAPVDQDPIMFRCEHWSRIRICFGGGHLWARIRIWVGFGLSGQDPETDLIQIPALMARIRMWIGREYSWARIRVRTGSGYGSDVETHNPDPVIPSSLLWFTLLIYSLQFTMVHSINFPQSHHFLLYLPLPLLLCSSLHGIHPSPPVHIRLECCLCLCM